MFIHFNSDEGEECDNCGTPHTIMHMSMEYQSSSVNLCLGCLSALSLALGHASKKLRLQENGGEPRIVSALEPKPAARLQGALRSS
jgi:hypothetical protein